MSVTQPLSREATYLLEVALFFPPLLPMGACLWNIKQVKSRSPKQICYLGIFSVCNHIQSFVFWELGWGTANPEVAELQKAANNGYVKADYFCLLIFMWVLIVSQTMIHVSVLQ